MHRQPHDHVATVMHVVGTGHVMPGHLMHDEIIQSSWLRCVQQHRLDPTHAQEAIILPSDRLRSHQDQMEDFIHIARHGLETLYQQVAGLGYCVLLTDAQGVTVDCMGDLGTQPSLRKAGLFLGSDWSEQHAGTCGVGTCIATGQALTVHQDDHFDTTHTSLTCTSAPVYDALGQLTAVLDISALKSPSTKESQHLALELVKVNAHYVENAAFLHRFRQDWVLRLSHAPQFLDVKPDYLLALNARGQVIGHNRRAQLLLEAENGGQTILGLSFERLFNATLADLGRFTQPRPGSQRTLALAHSKRVVFMVAVPPPARAATPQTIPRPIPAPLAALSQGDPVLDRQIARAAKLVNAPINLLLTGETGTGKEYFAKALHDSSSRRNRPFVAVNCAAIPDTLIESELFGYLPGSFSGAGPKGKRGLIQQANGGTLFLDEIGDMPLLLQARLLRVLSEREVLPVGATQPIAVTLHVVSATHCDLPALVRQGRFRDDLVYRISGAHLALPPLRERSDLGGMIDQLLRQVGSQAGPRSPAPVLSPEARKCLMSHRWPGNLRELRNVIDYARSVCNEQQIELEDLPDTLVATAPVPRSLNLPGLEATPCPPQDGAAELLAQLHAAHWNVSDAARALGLSRMTLYRRMTRWGIVSPNHSNRDAAP
jgi:sigma-54 dependent transcriptional regulator, acetoin dehydrogenase operon transcriptional activator AcoR